MVFAAGLGTRLYPLTKDRPKALVEIEGKTLLETVIQRIIDAGIHEIVVNVHHFSQLVKDFLADHPFDAEIRVSDESDFLLDTAGGLKFAEPLFENADHILLHNVDILSDININNLISNHIQSEALATLAVRNRKTSRYLLFDHETMRLHGWKNVKTGERKEPLPCDNCIQLAFSGIHVVHREIMRYIPPQQKLSLTPQYLDLAANHLIKGYLHMEGSWMDVGKYDDLVKARLI